MNKYERLKSLQDEILEVLTLRRNIPERGDFPRICGKAKFKRLRLEIQQLMLDIERDMQTCYKYGKEDFEK